MIGEIFTYEGKQYQAVEEPFSNGCVGCVVEQDGYRACVNFLKNLNIISNIENVDDLPEMVCCKYKIIFKYLGEIKQPKFRRIRL